MTEKKGPVLFKIPSPQHSQEAKNKLNAEFVKTIQEQLTKDGETLEITGKQEGPPLDGGSNG